MGARRVRLAGGLQLNVVARNPDGPAAPVLLVHGLASNARLWDGVAEHLAERDHPVVAVDQRGHGLSDKPDDGYDFATLTADLLALLDALGSDAGRPVAVAGQSWGANVALELAARHPDVVAALTLVDGGTMELSGQFADWDTCAAALAPPPIAGKPAADFERMLRSHHPDWPESGIAGTMANMEVLEDGTIRPWLSRPRHMTILRHLWEHRPPERYPLIAAPVLLMPADDPGKPRWMAGRHHEVDKAAAGLRRSVTRWIAGDHDLHAQHPGLVAELIDATTRPDFFP